MSDLDCCCFKCVKEKDIAIVENLGQYSRTATAGLVMFSLCDLRLCIFPEPNEFLHVCNHNSICHRMQRLDVPYGKHCWDVVTQNPAIECPVRH